MHKMTNFKWGSSSVRRMNGVNCILIEFANRLLEASPYDLTIGWMGGIRTVDQQQEIFLRGASKADGITRKSYHQSGNALDICISSKTIEGMYDKPKLNEVGAIGKEIWKEMSEQGLLNEYTPRWGGDFRGFYDPVHWELR